MCFNYNSGQACACVGYSATTTHCSHDDLPADSICRDDGDICSCVAWGCSDDPTSVAVNAQCSCRLGSPVFTGTSCTAQTCCFDPTSDTCDCFVDNAACAAPAISVPSCKFSDISGMFASDYRGIGYPGSKVDTCTGRGSGPKRTSG